ncbi:MAG: hypothetical protein Q8L27_04155, partial [archaeon]|nr:hypothetical protein [archaeon]
MVYLKFLKMDVKKLGVLIIAVFSLLMVLSFASAELNIKKTIVSAQAIPELNLPAIYTLEITNLNGTDIFS